LPDIESCVGVSEGQNHEVIVDTYDALDVFGFFFDWVYVDGFVFWTAYFALPIVKITIVVTPDDQSVGQGDLILVRNG